MRLGGEQLALGAPALVPADRAAKDLPRLFSFALRHGQGDLQASWTLRWPATSNRGPSSFDGIIDGGTSHFAAAHGSFHAATLPNGDMRITAVINADQR